MEYRIGSQSSTSRNNNNNKNDKRVVFLPRFSKVLENNNQSAWNLIQIMTMLKLFETGEFLEQFEIRTKHDNFLE